MVYWVELVSIGPGTGLFLVNKILFLSYDRFGKNWTGHPVRRFNRRFERFNAGLISKRFIERTEPDSSPVDGWTGRTGRSGPVFKTMVKTSQFHFFFSIL